MESEKTSSNLFTHVFDFNDDNKNEFINMLQYSVIAIIPIVIILRIVNDFFPEEDETKGNLEILVEAIGQILFIMAMIWFSDKAIRYFPTYTKTEYSKFNAINFILPLLLILSTMQTKFGAKINIVVERFFNYLAGSSNQSSKPQ